MKDAISSKIRSVSEREFRIVLPSRDNNGHSLNKSVYSDYIKKMSDEFGGVTIHKAFGCGRKENKSASNPDPPLQCEENLVIEASLNSSKRQDIESGLRLMNRLGKNAQKRFGQWGVLVQSDTIEDVGFAEGNSKKYLGKKMRKDGFDFFEP